MKYDHESLNIKQFLCRDCDGLLVEMLHFLSLATVMRVDGNSFF